MTIKSETVGDSIVSRIFGAFNPFTKKVEEEKPKSAIEEALKEKEEKVVNRKILENLSLEDAYNTPLIPVELIYDSDNEVVYAEDVGEKEFFYTHKEIREAAIKYGVLYPKGYGSLVSTPVFVDRFAYLFKKRNGKYLLYYNKNTMYFLPELLKTVNGDNLMTSDAIAKKIALRIRLFFSI